MAVSSARALIVHTDSVCTVSLIHEEHLPLTVQVQGLPSNGLSGALPGIRRLDKGIWCPLMRQQRKSRGAPWYSSPVQPV